MAEHFGNDAPNNRLAEQSSPSADQSVGHENQADRSTARDMADEFDTLVALLRQPAPSDTFSKESACERAVEAIRQLGRTPNPSELGPARSTDDETPALRALGQYQLLEKLGEGGMGAVYRALHTRLEKVVAVKVMSAGRVGDAEAIARFSREMKAVGRLNHPNIVGAFDAGEVDGSHYLVMELVDGHDLGAIIRRIGPLPLADACEAVRQAAVGLDHAHSHGLVHRDVKPSNLMLARQGEVKILDLGLARLAEQIPGGVELTGTGQMMGTFEYMAPEQGSDSHAVDHRADIYALGATLYKLLAGRAPFAGSRYDTPLKRIMALATEDPEPIRQSRPDVPKSLARLIHRMLARDPDHRTATVHEVADLLAPFAAGSDLVGLVARADEASPKPSVEPGTASTQPAASAAMEHTPHTIQISPPAAFRPRAASRWRRLAAWFGNLPPVARFGLTAAAGAAALVLLAVLLTVKTPQGTLVIESDDPNIEVLVKQNGEVIDILSADRGWKVGLKDGQYDVQLSGGADRMQLSEDQVTVIRGGRVLVRVSQQPNGAVAQRVPGISDRAVSPGVVKLTDLKATVLKSGRYNYTVNDVYPKDCWPSMAPNVKLAKEYLYAPAASRIRYSVPSGMKSFTAVAYCPCHWSVEYRVMVGDEILFEKTRLPESQHYGGTPFRAIRVDLPPETKEIDLVALQAYTQESMLPEARRFCWLAPRLYPVPADEVGDLFTPNGDHVSLSTAEPLWVKTLSSEVLRNRVPEIMAPPVAFDGVDRCEEFAYAMAPSHVEYEIPRGAKFFSAVGLCASGSGRFEVHVDNTRIYSSLNAGVVPVQVAIPEGASTLALIVDPLGSDFRDFAFWCYPRFHWPFPVEGSLEDRRSWVRSAMKQLNPQFNGDIRFEVEDDRIVGVGFTPPGWNVAITDISPLRELKYLRTLDLQEAAVQDLEPLAGLPLDRVNLRGSTTAPELWPLVDTRVEVFHGPVASRRNCRTLRQIESLRTINDRPVVEALRDVEELIAREAAEAEAARLQNTSSTETPEASRPAPRDESLPPGIVRLIDLDPMIAIAGRYSYSAKREGGPALRPDVELATEYLLMRSPSRVRYPIPEGMKSFTAVAYRPRWYAGKPRVVVGDKTLFESEKGTFTPIRIALPEGTTELELVVERGEEDGHVCWLVPRLHPMPADDIEDLFGDNTNHVSLTTLKPSPVTEGTPLPIVNRVPEEMAPPVVYRDFTPCDEFTYAFAPSRAEYEIPAGANRFSAIAHCSNGSVRFEVYADDTRIYSSPNAGIVPIEVAIPDGASILTLVTVGSNHRDHSTWCYPRLHGRFPHQGTGQDDAPASAVQTIAPTIAPYVDGDWVRVINRMSDLCIGVNGASTDPRASLHQYDPAPGALEQHWRIESSDQPGMHRLKNRKSGLYFTLKQPRQGEGYLQRPLEDDNNEFLFSMVDIDGKWFRIVSHESKLDAGIWGGSIREGEWIIQWPFAVGATDKYWRVEPVDKAGEQGWVDVLAQMDPQQHSVFGVWRRDGSRLLCDPLDFARIGSPVYTAGDYEVESQFRWIGKVGEVNLLLPVGDSAVHVWVRPGSGAIGQFSGGRSAPPAKTRTYEADRRYTLAATVRVDGATATIETRMDGEPYAKWSGPVESLYPRSDWMVPNRTLGFGAHVCSVSLDGFRVRPLEGGQLLRKTYRVEPVEIEPGQTIELAALVDPVRHAVLGKWEVADGAATCVEPREFARVAIPLVPRGDYELSGTLLRPKGLSPATLAIPVGRSYTGLEIKDKAVVLERVGGSPPWKRADVQMGPETQFAVRVEHQGDIAKIHVAIDGKPVLDWEGPTGAAQPRFDWVLTQPSLGLGTHGGPLAVKDLKYKLLSGTAERIVENIEPIPTSPSTNSRPGLPFPATGTLTEQKEWLVAELKRLNPEFDGNLRLVAERGSIVGLELTGAISDISPLAQLTALQSLSCQGMSVEDIAPLAGLQLNSVRFYGCRNVLDIETLRTMPLTSVILQSTSVSDLSPLEGKPLELLDIYKTPVTDFGVIQGMPLKWLNVGDTRFDDCSLLEGMPLEYLCLLGSRVFDLAPLAGHGSLKTIEIAFTPVSDLTPLANLRLRFLDLLDCKVVDLTPIKDSAFESIRAHAKLIEQNIPVLRNMTGLKAINSRPAAEVLREAEEKLKDSGDAEKPAAVDSAN